MPTSNIFFDVEEAGAFEYHEAGRFWYPHLEISYLLACLKRGAWDNNPRARSRRHELLYGDRGIWKTSIAKAMLYTYGNGNDLVNTSFSDRVTREQRPVILNLGGGGISWERARGSSTPKGDILEPYLPITNFMFSGELLKWLGSQKNVQDERVNTLNEIMEEGTVTVALVKMGGNSAAKLAQVAERMSAINVRFNPEMGLMQYDVNLSLIACSRFFNEDEQHRFATSGFLSRFHIAHWNPTDDEFRGAWRKMPGDGTAPNADIIKEFNARAWATTFGNVPYPDRHLMMRVQASYDRIYTKIESEFKVSALQVRSMRDIVDMAQLITARAISRTIEQKIKDDDGYLVPSLSYEESDAAWAARYVETQMKAKYDEWLARANVDTSENEDRALIFSFVKSQEGAGAFEANEFVSWAGKDAVPKMSRAKAFGKLKVMKERGWLITTKPGSYLISEDIMSIIKQHRTALYAEAAE